MDTNHQDDLEKHVNKIINSVHGLDEQSRRSVLEIELKRLSCISKLFSDMISKPKETGPSSKPSSTTSNPPQLAISPTNTTRIGLPKGISQAPERIKRILVIGETGSGKSSLINVLDPKCNAPISDSALGCTPTIKTYNAECNRTPYQLIDTVGLNEHSGGYKKAADAMLELVRFMRDDENGYNAILFVKRHGRIDKSFDLNYLVFVKCLTRHEIPTILVTTGCESEDTAAVEESLKGQLKEYAFNIILCGTTLHGGPAEKYLSYMREDMAKRLWVTIENVSLPRPKKIIRNAEDEKEAIGYFGKIWQQLRM